MIDLIAAVVGPIPLFGPLLMPIKFVSGGGGFVTAGTLIRPIVEGESSYATVLRDEGKDGGDWQSGVELKDSFPVTRIHSGAYGFAGNPGKPTFVLCGNAEEPFTEDSPGGTRGIIYTSSNGATWSQSYRGVSDVYLMAWDENKKAFFAQALDLDALSIRVLSSGNGLSWGTVDNMALSDEWPASPLLEATGTPLIRDNTGRIVPYGGVFGWNRNGNVWITPKSIFDIYASGRRDYGPGAVEIIRKIINPGGSETITRVTKSVPMQHCVAVGYAGGTWQAVGFDEVTSGATSEDNVARIARSTDDGQTWNSAYDHENQYINCLIAGKLDA